MNERNGRFWMVWCDGPMGRTPTYKYATQEEVWQEAERLATQNPGVRFWVLKAQGFLRIEPPPRTWTPAEDGLPF